MAKTDWISKDFHYHGGYLTYQSKFVARFKYLRGNMGDFKKFLIANLTPEEYFARQQNRESPLGILETKGYVSPHIRKELERLGYPVNPEGFKQMIRDNIQKRNQTTEQVAVVAQ